MTGGKETFITEKLLMHYLVQLLHKRQHFSHIIKLHKIFQTWSNYRNLSTYFMNLAVMKWKKDTKSDDFLNVCCILYQSTKKGIRDSDTLSNQLFAAVIGDGIRRDGFRNGPRVFQSFSKHSCRNHHHECLLLWAWEVALLWTFTQ